MRRILSPLFRWRVVSLTKSPSTASACFFAISWLSANVAARCLSVMVAWTADLAGAAFFAAVFLAGVTGMGFLAVWAWHDFDLSWSVRIRATGMLRSQSVLYEGGSHSGRHSSLTRNALVASDRLPLLRLRHDWSSRSQRKAGPMPLRSAKFWSNRAERARKITEQMDDWDARLAMLEIARHCENLAENSPLVEALDRRQPEDANEPK